MLDHFNRPLNDTSPLGYFHFLLGQDNLKEWKCDFFSDNPEKAADGIIGLKADLENEIRRFQRWEYEENDFVPIEESFPIVLGQKVKGAEQDALNLINSKFYSLSSFEKDRYSKSIINQLKGLLASALKNQEALRYPVILNSLKSLEAFVRSAYKDYINEFQSPPSFTFKGISPKSVESLKHLYLSLISDTRFEFLDPETNWPDFKKVFSGKVVKTRLIWIGSLGSLRILILRMLKLEKINDEKNMHWKIAVKCFLRHDYKNGEIVPITTSQLSGADRIHTEANIIRDALITDWVKSLEVPKVHYKV